MKAGRVGCGCVSRRCWVRGEQVVLTACKEPVFGEDGDGVEEEHGDYKLVSAACLE